MLNQILLQSIESGENGLRSGDLLVNKMLDFKVLTFSHCTQDCQGSSNNNSMS